MPIPSPPSPSGWTRAPCCCAALPRHRPGNGLPRCRRCRPCRPSGSCRCLAASPCPWPPPAVATGAGSATPAATATAPWTRRPAGHGPPCRLSWPSRPGLQRRRPAMRALFPTPAWSTATGPAQRWDCTAIRMRPTSLRRLFRYRWAWAALFSGAASGVRTRSGALRWSMAMCWSGAGPHVWSITALARSRTAVTICWGTSAGI